MGDGSPPTAVRSCWGLGDSSSADQSNRAEAPGGEQPRPGKLGREGGAGVGRDPELEPKEGRPGDRRAGSRRWPHGRRFLSGGEAGRARRWLGGVQGRRTGKYHDPRASPRLAAATRVAPPSGRSRARRRVGGRRGARAEAPGGGGTRRACDRVAAEKRTRCRRRSSSCSSSRGRRGHLRRCRSFTPDPRREPQRGAERPVRLELQRTAGSSACG